jgi:putative nucleotidyltransferase with HDIG domain
MLHNSQTSSAVALAATWLDRRMQSIAAAAHDHLRKRMALTTLAASLASAMGIFSYTLVSGSGATGGAFAALALATAVPILTAAALYPVLHLRNRWMCHATSTISRDNIQMLAVLGKLTELRDGETAGHNLRVTAYAVLFAEALQFPPDEIVRTAKGALLHDVGKIVVPDHILGKPGPLTLEERCEMSQHVRFGIEIVSQSEALQEATAVVAGHHEHYDGTGYPLGLKGKAIPREARLFALVDVFDALTSARVYKPALRVEEALAHMAAGRDSHFDPWLFDRFVMLAPSFIRRLPREEAALSALVMEKLTPYFDRFVHLEPAPGSIA